MKISKPAKIALAFSASLSAFLPVFFSGCKKENRLAVEETASSIQAQNKEPSKLKKLDAQTKAYLNGKNIILILGYGYNDENSIEKITRHMTETFGVETEEKLGLVSIFVYPNDFMAAGKARVSSLVNLLEDKNPAGILILGAPDGMHIALSKLQDNSDEKELPYPVFSFFSQDDVLGSEATADFVLDYAHKADNLTAETEAAEFIPDFDLCGLLDSAILAMAEMRPENPREYKNLSAFVSGLFGGKRTITHYIDGETGLQSINHFIFE